MIFSKVVQYYSILMICRHSSVVELRFCKPSVVGSNPTAGSIFSFDIQFVSSRLIHPGIMSEERLFPVQKRFAEKSVSMSMEQMILSVVSLILNLFLLLFVVIQFCQFIFFRSRLTQLEDLLKKLLKEKEKPLPVQQKTPVASSVVPQEVTNIPPRPEIKKQLTAIEKKGEKESLWANFCKWFVMGHYNREEISKEYAVATTWLIRSGVIILLCGIGFFLKYSIEKELVTPPVRITGTFLTSILLFAAGYYGINKRFHLLAVGLLSIGTVTFYMGAFAGYKFYHLFPIWTAFLFMLLASAISMSIAAKYKLLPLALTGCTGGYLVPVLLSSSSGNVTAFTAYLAVISAGVLIISRIHRWRSLECTAFCVSFLFAFTAVFGRLRKTDHYTLLFLFILFLIYLLIPLIRKKEHAFALTEWLLPVGANVFTLALGVTVIHNFVPEVYKGVFSGSFALLLCVCTLTAGILLRKLREDGRKLFSAFLAASLFTLFLAVPLTFKEKGAWICSWSVLGFILIYAYSKSKEKVLSTFGILSCAGALLFILITNEHGPAGKFVTRFFTMGVFSLALPSSGFLLLASKEKEDKLLRNVFFIAGTAAFLVYTSIEIYTFFAENPALKEFRNGGLTVWWAVSGILLLGYGIRKKIKAMRLGALLLFLTALVKIYTVDIASFNTLHKVIAFLLLGVLFMGGAFAYMLTKKYFSPEKDNKI